MFCGAFQVNIFIHGCLLAYFGVFLDVAGFVKVYSAVKDVEVFGYPDKELFVVLASGVKGGVWSVDLFS